MSSTSTTTAKPANNARAKKSMPPGRPKSSNPITRLIAWIWKYEVWMEGTTSLGMMELWEKLLVVFVFLTLSSLIWWSFYFHFPNHIRTLVARSTYYIFGTTPSTSKEILQSAASQAADTAKANAASLHEHLEF